MPADSDVDLLRSSGLQVTSQRLAVMDAVATRPHSTADEIYAEAKAGTGAISRQAVYDVLAALTDKGLLRRIQPSGSSARYENRVADNHHHLVCRSCEQVVDVDCALGATPCLIASDDRGFEIDEAEVVYRGLCPRCLGANADLITEQSASTRPPSPSPTKETVHRV